eukprot:7382083-Prymnesium_polylepis.1
MRHGQPHASAPGSTPSLLYRRYSRFELLGKLGSEFLLDRHMTVRDHRRHMLRCDVVQRRVTGRMGSGAGAADADAPDSIEDPDAPEEMRPSVPSFLPDTEPGSPRYQYAMCADAIFCTHALGTPIWFVTNTADPHWWECATRLPAFETERVPLDDRSNTSMRTALENDWPALTKPTWQNLCAFATSHPRGAVAPVAPQLRARASRQIDVAPRVSQTSDPLCTPRCSS